MNHTISPGVLWFILDLYIGTHKASRHKPSKAVSLISPHVEGALVVSSGNLDLVPACGPLAIMCMSVQFANLFLEQLAPL